MSILRQNTHLYPVRFNVLHIENVNLIRFNLPMTIYRYNR